MNLELRLRKAPFGITIFLSAFLLFWVQLLLGKYVLPWFGGAAAVWTTCMLFFQVLLLAGYAYSHWLTSRLKARAQTLLHCAIIVSSLFELGCLAIVWNSPITPGSSWKPNGVDHPVIQIVTLLSVSVGLPFFVLSSTGPLLQAWYWRVYGGASPYRLYSLSNLGSFLSLLAFPALLEPALTLKSQGWLWALAYLVFAVSCVYNALRGVKGSRQEIGPQDVAPTEQADGVRPGKGNYLLWGSLSACASILFLATTNQICQDIGVVPLLWIVPLGTQRRNPTRAAYCLKHGRVVHGCQLRAQDLRQTPTAYYGPSSGVGIAILHAASAVSPIHRNLRIGVVGLGVGTLAAYGKPGDTMRFYEINPDVVRIASDQRYFSFLSDSSARIQMVTGDGRLSLENEFDLHEQQDFDVLVIDAFSGDAIPVHLLTLEAFETYIKSLKKPSGILAIHITNSYLNLRPVVVAAARRLGLQAITVYSAGDGRTTSASTWVLLSSGDNLPEIDAPALGVRAEAGYARTIHPWTDDYSNVFQILNR